MFLCKFLFNHFPFTKYENICLKSNKHVNCQFHIHIYTYSIYTYTHCYVLNCVTSCWSPSSLPPSIAFGGRVFKGVTNVKWDHMGGALIPYDWSLWEEEETQEMNAHREQTMCKDRGRRRPPVSQWDKLRNIQHVPTPWSWTSSLSNCDVINFCDPTCGVFWRHL